MFGTRALFGRALLIVEHDGKKLLPPTLSTLTAAKKLGDVTALVAGKNVKAVADEAAKLAGVSKVLHVEADEYATQLPEPLAKLVHKIAADQKATHVVASHSALGRGAIPRAAALADCQSISDVVEVKDETTFVRPIYAGNAIATVRSTKDPIKFLTVRATAFEKAAAGGSSAAVETAPGAGGFEKSVWVKDAVVDTGKPDLATARVVVSGGRGLKNGENFKLLDALADKLGNCAVGATRAMVDSGYASPEMQIGQTGKVVAPELYIAVGLSGAIQHLAGMKDSKVICCINTDPDAPIFTVSDYGLVGDLFDAVPKLTKLI